MDFKRYVDSEKEKVKLLKESKDIALIAKTLMMGKANISQMLKKSRKYCTIHDLYRDSGSEDSYKMFAEKCRKIIKRCGYNVIRLHSNINVIPKKDYEMILDLVKKSPSKKYYTLQELHKDSGISTPYEIYFHYYKKMIQDGKLNVTRPKHKSGNFIAKEEYDRILLLEREKANARMNWIKASQISKEMKIDSSYLSHKIRILSNNGVLHPILVGKLGYLISPDEVPLLKDRKIKTPKKRTLKNKEKAERLIHLCETKPQLFNIIYKDIPPSVEKELWNRARKGDNNSFMVLDQYYKSEFPMIQFPYLWATDYSDRQFMLDTAIFSLIAEHPRPLPLDQANAYLISQLRARNKEERYSELSLDSFVGNDGSKTRFSDFATV